ncbi:MAG: SurA N-terminal domain-containing protein [Comamonadaceae bacterium]|nr:SurA N-terminal domain-containing protein [Comamonadaceae bacterium]
MFDFVRNHTRAGAGHPGAADLPVVRLLRRPGLQPLHRRRHRHRGEGRRRRRSRRAEWDAAHQRNVERLRRQMPDIDAKLLDTPEMRRETLDGLVRERVLLAAARELHLVPERRAAAARCSHSDPQFATCATPTAAINRDAACRAGHERRDASSSAAPGARACSRCSAASGQSLVRAAAGGRDRRSTRCCSAARSSCSASTPSDYRAQVDADRRRPRGLLQGATRRSSARPSRRRSSTSCSTSSALAKDVTVPEEDLRTLLRPRTPAATPRPRSAAPATS